MNEDILRLAGIINEDGLRGLEMTANKYAMSSGMYQAMAGIVKNKLEFALRQLENPEWNREDDSRIMLDHLEKAAREAVAEIDRIQKKIHAPQD